MDPPACRCCTNIFRKLGSRPNKARCSISVSLWYASFQELRSRCEIDFQCVENLRPCWHCCADTCWGLWCPWMPEKLPLLSYLLNQSPPHVLLFHFVCVPKHLSHTFSSGTALWLHQSNTSAPKVSPHFLRLSNLLLDTFYLLCAPNKVSIMMHFCCGAWHFCTVCASQTATVR